MSRNFQNHSELYYCDSPDIYSRYTIYLEAEMIELIMKGDEEHRQKQCVWSEKL